MSDSAAMVAFAKARLDEDEARAEKAQDEWDAEWVTQEWQDLPGEVFAHARTHDPARVLREVEAKRAILGWANSPALPGHEKQYVLRYLIAVWSDHPDYDASWKP